MLKSYLVEDWSILSEMDEKKFSIAIDSHFLGFTILSPIHVFRRTPVSFL